jgi:hypothetical protein
MESLDSIIVNGINFIIVKDCLPIFSSMTDHPYTKSAKTRLPANLMPIKSFSKAMQLKCFDSKMVAVHRLLIFS